MGGSPGDVSEEPVTQETRKEDWRISCDVREATEGLGLILQPFRHFTYVTAHSPSLPSLHLRHSSFSNISVTSPSSQLILQLFRHFTYVTAHSRNLPSLHLRHSSFSNFSVTSPTSKLILQPFRRFTYVTAHSPTLPSLYLHQSSFSNSSVASPMSQLILQPFHRFTYVTAHSPTLPSLYLRYSSFSNSSFASPTSQTLHIIHLATAHGKNVAYQSSWRPLKTFLWNKYKLISCILLQYFQKLVLPFNLTSDNENRHTHLGHPECSVEYASCVFRLTIIRLHI